MQIRRMGAEHIREAALLQMRYFAHPWTEKDYRSFYQDREKICLVAVCDNTVVGSCMVWCSFDVAELCNIVVAEAFRGQGGAQRLLAEAFRLSRIQGAERMLLEVRESNIPAIALYKRFAFEKISVRNSYYRDPVEDAWIMQAKLSGKSGMISVENRV